MNIIFSVNNNEEVVVLPVVPPDIAINSPQKNETKESMALGEIKLIGLPGLRNLSISSFFPVNKKYSFIKPQAFEDGWRYVEFFEKWRKKRAPFRIVITDKNQKEILNMAVAINNFNYSPDKVGDINYTLDIEEYPLVR